MQDEKPNHNGWREDLEGDWLEVQVSSQLSRVVLFGRSVLLTIVVSRSRTNSTFG